MDLVVCSVALQSMGNSELLYIIVTLAKVMCVYDIVTCLYISAVVYEYFSNLSHYVKRAIYVYLLNYFRAFKLRALQELNFSTES